MAVHSVDRQPLTTALDRISLRATAKPETVFNNIGHALTEELLLEAAQALDGTKALGIDKVSKAMYEENLSQNIRNLMRKIRTGQYRPKPVRIVEIPKDGDGTRPLAISCFEDKIVQWAVAKILNTIYEPTFLSSSYGFRPNRNCHDALRALTRTTYQFKQGAIIEIDLKQCFNTIPHGQLLAFIQEKITDSRFLDLIETLITMPILRDGQTVATERGCPQGSIASPILSNIYLHHVIDRWFQEVSKSHFKGQAELIRYADDMVFSFEEKEDAERFWKVLPKRLEKYGLSLHPEKSRLMESGSFAAKAAELAGKRMPTYQFLGFTCYWGKSRNGVFWRIKYTSRADRFTRALKSMRSYLRDHLTTSDVEETLEGVVRRVKGWLNYHAISDNQGRVHAFIAATHKMIFKWFNRRGGGRYFRWKSLYHWLNRVHFPKLPKTISMFQDRRGQDEPALESGAGCFN